MEHFTKESGNIKGLEVLFLENVEIQKIFGTRSQFASAGALQVLFVKEYNRYFLKVNDFLYPLMKRIPIYGEQGALSKIYLLPTTNGFSYRLIINDTTSAAFRNFETLLSNTSGFTNEDSLKVRERSPDDKMSRPTIKKEHSAPITSNKAVSGITGLLKTGIEKVKNAAMGLAGTKSLTSTKKRINQSEIKTKNFRQEAQSTFKKNFFSEELKLTQKFFELRSSNLNNTEEREFKDLKKVTDVPTIYLFKETIEEAIFRNKDVIEQRMYNDIPEVEKKGIVGMLKDTVSGIIHREAPKHVEAEPQLVEHYQG